MCFSLFLFETEISCLIYHFESIKEYKEGQLFFFFVCLKIRDVMSSITIFHLIHSFVYL